MKKYEELHKKLTSLTVFRSLLEQPVMARLTALLGAEEADGLIEPYCALVHELYRTSDSLADRILSALAEDENIYVSYAAEGREAGEPIKSRLAEELAILGEAASLRCEDVIAEIGADIPLPRWRDGAPDVAAYYNGRLNRIATEGYGIFAAYHVFRADAEGRLLPVRRPDPQRLSELYGYENERGKVLKNTLALVEGLSANNVLLYGDAGTGKSSTVKAVVNELKDRGLRLIELQKSQLFLLPDIMDRLEGSPLKFIIFIDDLSFNSGDGDFAALKAILEGGVSSRGSNVAVYATSNRRHLVRETMSERDGDDVHLSDTLQELQSLSARFGLTVTFLRPEKDVVADIVLKLAEAKGITADRDELCRRAEAYAIRAGGRTPRAAKQFVELVRAGVM